MEIKNINSENILAYSLLLFLFLVMILCSYILLNTFWGDSTIYLIYAKNIANGYFLSFNPGEFSSGATSPLWAIILSPGFILNNGVTISKIISLFFTLLALFATYTASLKISKSKIGSAISLGFLIYFLTLPGLLIYESSFIICLVSTLILLNFYTVQYSETKYLWIIGIIWALIPLVRPESLVVVIINSLILLLKFRNDKKFTFKLLLILFLSFLPSILYFGYSYLKLGIISSSTAGRAFALEDAAKNHGSIYLWPFYTIFTQFNILIGLIIGSFGIIKERRNLPWLIAFNLAALISYILIFTVYSPVIYTIDAKRYILPVIPFIVVFIGIGISKILQLCNKKIVCNFIIISLIISMIALPSLIIMGQSINESNRDLNFDVIVEKSPVYYLNSVAETNATVLIFEVQDRYYLRHDLRVLSLDGITDGKIVPYLFNQDITAFLWKYKPRYWIANDAISRPFYSNTLLQEAVNKTGKIEGISVKINGITFKNIKKRKEPVIPEFAGYSQIYELNYD